MSEEFDNGVGEGGVDTKFVEVDGKKFVDNGEGQPKVGDDGQPVPFIEKQVETPEARKARLERELSRHKEKYPDLYKDPEEDKSKSKKGKKSDEVELDFGQKAYLIALGIKSDKEMELVQKSMQESGKDLDTVINSNWFKAELKDLQDTIASGMATPDGSKRGNQSSVNTVEYWIAKGELPPNTPENRELRQKVVNARLKKETSKNEFTDSPVVGKV